MSNSQWCPLSRLVNVLGDSWSILILRELAAGPLRFKELKNNVVGISMDQLTRKLAHLDRSQLIVRQEFSEAPPRVQYQLTEKGKTLIPVLRRMLIWGYEKSWGQPALNENVDLAVTLKTMACFFGTGSGSVLFRLSGGDQFLVERNEEGAVRVLERV